MPPRPYLTPEEILKLGETNSQEDVKQLIAGAMAEWLMLDPHDSYEELAEEAAWEALNKELIDFAERYLNP